MKHLLAVVVVAGCAAGSRPAGGEDASTQSDAPNNPFPDSPLVDARLVDAPLVDAPLIDAPLAIDAMIDAPVITPDACVPTITQLAANPSFDLAPVGVNWSEIRYSSSVPLVVTDTDAQSGVGYALLGGYESGFDGLYAEDYLYQDFVIPPNTTSLVISGYVAVLTNDSLSQPYDIAGLGLLFPNSPSTPGILVLALDNTDAGTIGGTWTPFSQTIVQNLSGQTVRFQMESSSDWLDPTIFAFDTLSVTATSGCP